MLHTKLNSVHVDGRPAPGAFQPATSVAGSLMRMDLALATLFTLLGLALRLVALDAPLLDYHSWRQTVTAMVARNFTRYGYNIFAPMIDSAGAHPVLAEMEFPLQSWLIAIIWGIFGEQHWGARLVSALFTAGGTFCFYLLIRRVSAGNAHKRTMTASLATMIYTLSPFHIFFGRAVMPDAMMLALSIAALLAGITWLDQVVCNPDSKWGWQFWATIGLMALAGLVKIPALLVLLPLGLVWLARPQTRRLVAHMLIYSVGVCVPVVAWYIYAASITDPAAAFGLVSQGSGNRVGVYTLWFDPNFFPLLWRWLHENILTRVGLVLAILGFIVCVATPWKLTPEQHQALRRADFEWLVMRLFGLLWALAVFIFVMVAANGIVSTDYYYLPAVSPGALLAAEGLAWIIQLLIAHRTFAWQIATGFLIFISLGSVAYESATRTAQLYIQNTIYYQTAQELRAATPARASILSVQYSNPEILYYADRPGVPVEPRYFNAQMVENWRQKGIQYLLITSRPDMDSKPDMLAVMKRYPLVDYSDNWVLFDLQATQIEGNNDSSRGSQVATFGDEIVLEQATLAADAVTSGRPIRVRLQWRALRPPAGNYSLSLRLFASDGTLVTQSDARPLGGLWRTDLWPVGQLLSDISLLHVPVGTPPGNYRIEARMYGFQGELTRSGAGILEQQAQVLPAINQPIQQMQHSIQRTWHGLTLLGYELPQQPYQPGEIVPVTLLWRRERDVLTVQELRLGMIPLPQNGGAKPGISTFPISNRYPHNQWQPGELVRVVYPVPVPPAAQTGSYQIELEMGAANALKLAEINVQARQRSAALPDMPYSSQTSFRDVGGSSPAAYQVSTTSVQSGKAVTLTIAWKAGETTPINQKLKVFTHLVGTDGKVWAQDDRFPCDGGCPTTSWLPGEVLVEPYVLRIPADAPEGVYQIALGWYDPATGKRAITTDGKDHILLAAQLHVAK